MRQLRAKQDVAWPQEEGTRDAAFYLFCAFIVSYFTHLTARVTLLASLHFDLLLAALTAAAIMLAPGARRRGPPQKLRPVEKQLWILVGYIIVTLPFVEWPGSALHNLEGYAKSLCFFFFVVATVDTTRKLSILIIVYALTQVWRVLEPLIMHIRSGYWGSSTNIGSAQIAEMMDRLSGSPYDIINPNGLAFVIIMTLPLLHLLLKPERPAQRGLMIALVAAMSYALVLSASRSGFLGLMFLLVLFVWRSKHRAAYLVVGALVVILGVSLMTELQRERYLSIFSDKAAGAQTVAERIEGIKGDLTVTLRRPIFGHGLGTSREANANFRGVDLPSHNLYLEVAEELGYVGLVLVLILIWRFLQACWTAQRVVAATPMDDPRLRFLHDVARALVVVVLVDLFFSFASFGLTEPYWYFFGGLSVVTARLAVKLVPEAASAAGAGRSSGPRRPPGTNGMRRRGLLRGPPGRPQPQTGLPRATRLRMR